MQCQKRDEEEEEEEEEALARTCRVRKLYTVYIAYDYEMTTQKRESLSELSSPYK